MPPTFVQNTNNLVTGSSTTVTVAITLTAGNLVIVCCSPSTTPSHISSLTDTLGNTYAAELSIASGGSGSGYVRYSYAYNVIGGATTITCVFDGAQTNNRIWVTEVSGIETAFNPFDKAVGQFETAPGTAVDGLNTTTVTTTTDGQYIWAHCRAVNTAANPTAGTGFTQRSQSTTWCTEDLIQTTAGVIQATFTMGSNQNAVADMLTFKAATAITPTPTYLRHHKA
jgi:hypothetical protein